MNLNHEIVASIGGVAVIFSVLLDAFETMVLPRRVTRHFRLTAWFLPADLDAVAQDREADQDGLAAAKLSAGYF